VGALCEAASITCQGYYQARKRSAQRQQRESAALALIRSLRAELPNMGTRKLYHECYTRLRELGLGRDQLFSLLRQEGLLMQPKRRYVSTTDSRHGFGVTKNLLLDSGKAYRPSRPNEVFVSDITYIETMEGFRYASLVTDAYSRKIVGWDLSSSLSIEGSLRALKMALSQASKSERKGLIHHSDRGVQYCSRAYRQALRRVKARASMSARGNPYENAMAERVNGILKQEFGMYTVFKTETQARRSLREAVRLYNDRRPHLSLGYRKPSEVHAEQRLAA
jgi:transposase InsO family protein